MTALMVAAASGSEHSARALLARGATADARDAAGRTALCTPPPTAPLRLLVRCSTATNRRQRGGAGPRGAMARRGALAAAGRAAAAAAAAAVGGAARRAGGLGAGAGAGAPAARARLARRASGGAAPPALGLVMNCGSSSIKYGVFAPASGGSARLLASGLVEGVGAPAGAPARVTHTVLPAGGGTGEAEALEGAIADHAAGLSRVSELLLRGTAASPPVGGGGAAVRCVGHRIVHGGTFSEAMLLDEEAKAAVRAACDLAPLHNPPALLGLEVAEKLFPEAAQVGVFDTAFHQTMGPEAYTYALPEALRVGNGVRRYGFHGSSYSYVQQATAAALGRRVEDLNLIVCHLGSGASMACIEGGRSVDTTMGMTPMEGLVMGTRAGDVDPGALTFLLESMSPAELSTMLNKESGLKGLSGKADMRSVLEGAAKGNADCKVALDVWVHRVRKYLGAYLVKLGGKCDAIVFTGGIGEQAAPLRAAVCARLEPLGIALDEGKNAAADGLAELQTAFSRTKVMVVPTNEELSIALQAFKVANCAAEPFAAAAADDDDPAAAAQPPKRASGEKKASGGLFVSSAGSGTSGVVELGIMRAASSSAVRVGYFRPVADHDDGDEDSHIQLLRDTFDISDAPSSMWGVTKMQAREALAAGKEDELLESIIGKYEEMKEGKDFVLVGGTDLGLGSQEWNTKVASALSLPVVMCENGSRTYACGSTEGIFRDVTIAAQQLVESKVKLAGVVVNKVPEADFAAASGALRERFASANVSLLGVLPDDPQVGAKSLTDVKLALDATAVHRADLLPKHDVRNVIVADSTLEDALSQWAQNPKALVMVHASRIQIVMGLMLAMRSGAYPPLSGIVLAGDEELPPVLRQVLSTLNDMPLPILQTRHRVYEALQRVSEQKRKLRAESIEQVEAAERMFEGNVDNDALRQLVGEPVSAVLTPKFFQHRIFKAARDDRKRIVLPEGDDPRVVQAAAELQRRGLCDVLLLGKPDEVAALAAKHQVDLTGVEIVYPPSAPDYEGLVDQYTELRKAKGMTREKAAEMFATEFNWYGTMKMKVGDVDGMVSGACHSTADTMRPALQVIKTAPGYNFVSSIFFMLLPERVQIFGDCAIILQPDEAQLAEIAATCAATATAFGIDPRVAMLSYSTGESGGKGVPMIDHVKAATLKARELDPVTPIEGPIQFDAAVDPAVAAVKFKGAANPVAGQASVLVFPDLNAGNNAYKAVQQASGCIAMGPIMQGMARPVNDLSRGCSVEDVVNTAVITVIQAQQTAARLAAGEQQAN